MKIMSETKSIVLTVVRNGQTDGNKERLVQARYLNTMSNQFFSIILERSPRYIVTTE